MELEYQISKEELKDPVIVCCETYQSLTSSEKDGREKASKVGIILNKNKINFAAKDEDISFDIIINNKDVTKVKELPDFKKPENQHLLCI